MAAPVVASSSVSASVGSPVSVGLPAGIVSGNLLVIFLALGANSTVTTPGGWNVIPGLAVTNYLAGFYRVADGTEGGSVNITLGTSIKTIYIALRITGASTSVAPAVGSVASGTGYYPNPPSLTSGFGAVDTLWIALGFQHDSGSQNIAAWPTDYLDSQLSRDYGGSNSAFMAMAARGLNAATEDPGQFQFGLSLPWYANTIAIKPSGTTFTKTLTAAVTFSAGVTKTTKKPLAGSITPSGSVTKKALKALAGSITPAGTVAKTAQKVLAGSVSFAGSVVADHIFVLVFEAAVAFAGSITKQTQKVLSGSLVPAASISIGRLIHAIAKISDAVTWLAKSAHLPFTRGDQDIHTAKAEITSSATVIAVTTHEKVT